MRMIFLAGMMSIAAVAAQAGSSIDVIGSGDSAPSIDYVTCTGCAPLKSKKVKAPEVMLKSGTQKIEFKEVNGVLKVYRTEAWLGGSPVTFVSKASIEQMQKFSAETVPADMLKAGAGIDKDATTSAVNADMSGTPAPAVEPAAVEKFDPQALQLRLQ